MNAPIPQLSGAIFLDQIKVLTEHYGQPAIDQALAALEPQEREEIRGLLAMSWCDSTLAMRFKNELARAVGMNELELQRFVTRAGIERTLRGVWRFLVSQLWDDALVKRVPSIYSRAFDRGSMRAEGLRPGGSSFVLKGWPTIPDYDAHGLAFGMESILTVAGRKNVRVSWRREGAEVVFTASWQK